MNFHNAHLVTQALCRGRNNPLTDQNVAVALHNWSLGQRRFIFRLEAALCLLRLRFFQHNVCESHSCHVTEQSLLLYTPLLTSDRSFHLTVFIVVLYIAYFIIFLLIDNWFICSLELLQIILLWPLLYYESFGAHTSTEELAS